MSSDPVYDAIQSLLVGEAVAHAGYAILVADDRMRYLAASDAALDLLGYTRAELLELSVADVVEDSDAEERYDDMRRTTSQRGTITLIAKDGRRIPALYDARETRVAGLQYYVSILRPLIQTS